MTLPAVWLVLLLAAGGPAGPADCDCAASLRFVRAQVEENYPGFADKVNDSTRASYRRLTDSLAQGADSGDCLARLRAYVGFFRDGHLRVSPGAATVRVDRSAPQPPVGLPSLSRADRRTLVLRLPSFEAALAPVLDSLLRARRAELARTPNLVLDLRGNGGGSDFTFFPLLPYLYTDTIRMVNAAIYATEGNIGMYRRFLTERGLPDSLRPELLRLVDSLEAHRGELVGRADQLIAFDSVRRYPSRVAVVVDSGCASSCEELVLAAEQSGKTTVIGGRTAGILDYANDRLIDTPCWRFVLALPTSRSQRLPANPVDPDGIAPAVAPPAGADPVDWARRYLELDEPG